jgi:hypothetical protein
MVLKMPPQLLTPDMQAPLDIIPMFALRNTALEQND